ncbi:hypothetical protein [Paraflavitalea pollutisoli]|uniref:hypothetical protein n=1 Tax=Paraflavitalea pollutisoli TaxID=3034143 RepID=UPI0023EB6C24|nr:hypothetical protein [Paraflavitalea sp. H1-2-19X]
MMNNTVIADTTWNPDAGMIITSLSGQVNSNDIERWERSLQTAFSQLPDESSFKIFVNLYGFKAVDFEVHKRFRSIVPLSLAAYGWRVGYLDLFEEAANLPLVVTRGIRCTAAAHAHQDETKIQLYESSYSHDREHYFTDPLLAEQWIRSL